MKTASLLLCCLIVAVPGGRAAEKGWRGIVPLHSTRADVEGRLGPGSSPCKCDYYLDDENVFLIYSAGDCERTRWAVPADTVLWITVYPKQQPRLADLNIDKSALEKQQVLGDRVTYVNRREGVSLTVDDGFVTTFLYGPTAEDQYLKCPNFDDPVVPGDLAKELVERLRERLNQFTEFARNLEAEKLYDLYLPEFARLRFNARSRGEFGRLGLAPDLDGITEYWVDARLSLVLTVENDKRWGKAYDISVIARTIEQGEIVESIRTTRAVIRNGQWYFVDLFRLAPMSRPAM
ncbi:MAG TPA: hypothetical protein VFV34_12695 [Blastocatellia bacterium]|nr:hypothetical protein [Blastocatellia bacterium]